MLYLIKQALKTAKEKEQEETPATVPNSTLPNLTFSGSTRLVVNGTTVTAVNSPMFTVTSGIEAGDKLSQHKRALYEAFDRYVEENSEEMDRIEEVYSGGLPDFDDFLEDLRETDVLLSNETFEDSYDITELIQSFFEYYC